MQQLTNAIDLACLQAGFNLASHLFDSIQSRNDRRFFPSTRRPLLPKDAGRVARRAHKKQQQVLLQMT
jgi:hypothetical protein